MIPKGVAPEGPEDCRNIACMNYLSKTLKGFILEWARERVMPGQRQFDGEKSCSTAHFLIDATEKTGEPHASKLRLISVRLSTG